MALAPIKQDQNAFHGWYLQPTGVDPGDAFAFLTVASPAERNQMIRKGFILLGDVRGGLGDPEDPLTVRPPSLETAANALRELQRRVPAERTRLEELMQESAIASGDMGISMDERGIYRERVKGFQAKITETYRVKPPTKKDVEDIHAEFKASEAAARDPANLDDERREARDRARALKLRLDYFKRLTPYTPALFRRYFLLAFRVQLENRVPKPHWEIQQRLAQIAEVRAEEQELTIQIQAEGAEEEAAV